MQDVADEAGVVQTAVYYHFSGKEELYNEALRRVFEQVSEQARSARDDTDEATGPAALPAVIRAVWTWLDAHPDEARLYAVHGFGGTSEALPLRREFEERHLQRAFAYFPTDSRRRKETKSQLAAQTLALRTLMTTLVNAHTLRFDGGALSHLPSDAVRREVEAVSTRILMTS